MLKLYGFTPSGNSDKPRLLLAHLGIEYAWEEVDVTRKGTRTQSFLARNPNGKVPLLELDNGEFLSESNAILHYFAQGTRFFPTDPLAQARVMQWLFFEFFVCTGFSIADIALYAYTHVAPEGGFDLEPHKHIRAWLTRVASVPGHVAMTDTAHLHA